MSKRMGKEPFGMELMVGKNTINHWVHMWTFVQIIRVKRLIIITTRKSEEHVGPPQNDFKLYIKLPTVIKKFISLPCALQNKEWRQLFRCIIA